MTNLQDPTSTSLLPLKTIADERGTLVSVQTGPGMPFEIRRVFFMVGMSHTPRGLHAHRKLHELLICMKGSCRVIVDDGRKLTESWLNRPDEGLHLPPWHWVEINEFSEHCVLLVLASEPYEEDDYIRDYATFLAGVTGKNVR